MSREDRNSACPPSWYVPTSNDTRVRVLDLAKIMARVFPASGASRYPPVFMRWARSNRRGTSSRDRSVTARKSRLLMDSVGAGQNDSLGLLDSTRRGMPTQAYNM